MMKKEWGIEALMAVYVTALQYADERHVGRLGELFGYHKVGLFYLLPWLA